MTTPRRWPKGTYMQLISAERLRAFVGPGPDKKMSGRRLARAIGKTPGTIDHLLAGRMTTCEPLTAQRIAEALEVPLEILFAPKPPSVTQSDAKQHAADKGSRPPQAASA